MKRSIFMKDFNLVVIGQIISLFGSSILRFALNLYILDLTGRADVFALVMAVSAVPGILFTPLGGGIADRFNRRNLMVIFDFTSSGIVLLLLLLMKTGHGSVWVIGVILSLLSIISSMYQPTVQASIPLLVNQECLVSANGVVNGVGSISSMMGPILGGILYSFIGLERLIVASCLAFLFSAIMEIFIHIPFEKAERTGHIIPAIFHDMKSGIRYVLKDNPTIAKLIAMAAALNLLMSPILIVGLPFVLRITMGSSEVMYGFGMGVCQVCAVLGALCIGIISKKLTVPTIYRLLLLSAMLFLPAALAITPLMLNTGYWIPFVIFVVFLGGVMLCATVISIFAISGIQMQTPNPMLGKVMAIVMAAAQCAAPLGQALYGVVLEVFSPWPYIPVLIASAFTILIALAAKAGLAK